MSDAVTKSRSILRRGENGFLSQKGKGIVDMETIGNGYTLSIVKMKGHCKWAVKATIGKEFRYRPFYYKVDAEKDFAYWNDPPFGNASDFMRDFKHNFNSPSEIKEKE
jgi:hypothetical protein